MPSTPDPTIPLALRRFRTDWPHVSRWCSADSVVGATLSPTARYVEERSCRADATEERRPGLRERAVDRAGCRQRERPSTTVRDGEARTGVGAGTVAGDWRRGRGQGSATTPYRSTPPAPGCTTSPGRRTRWPRPALRRSPRGGTSLRPRSVTGWSGCMRGRPCRCRPLPPEPRPTRRAVWPGADSIPPGWTP